MCLKINVKQSVKLESGTIKFENCFEQIAVPIKIYADFECNLEIVHANERGNDTSYTKKNQNHIPCSFAYKIVCIDDYFSKPVVLYRSENAVHKFIKSILKKYNYRKKLCKTF